MDALALAIFLWSILVSGRTDIHFVRTKIQIFGAEW